MILAYHAIWTTYGTWLPNDPRGSFSEKIYNDELSTFGDIRQGRQHPQPPAEHLRQFWTKTRHTLKRPPFFLDDRLRMRVAQSFGAVVDRLKLHVYACAIMNDHVHIVVARGDHRIEYVVGQLKGAATDALSLDTTPWARGCWKVFLNTESAIMAASRYVEHNPIQAGHDAQDWTFVNRLEIQ
jgi:REP element-mobilizing transposase RayT